MDQILAIYIETIIIGVATVRSISIFNADGFFSCINFRHDAEYTETKEEQPHSRHQRQINNVSEWMEASEIRKFHSFRDTRKIVAERMVCTNQACDYRDEFGSTRYLLGFHCRSTQNCQGVKRRTRSRDLSSIEHHWIRKGTCLGGGSEYAFANTLAFF